MLSTDERNEIDHEILQYEQRRGACIDALRIVQKYRRWISDESVRDVAGYLGMSPEEVDSIATFYNLIFRKPVGEHVIYLCDSVSCWICGSENLKMEIAGRLRIRPGETTADGRFTLVTIQCLGTCDHAPAMMIDDTLYRDIAPGTAGRILENHAKGTGGHGAPAHVTDSKR